MTFPARGFRGGDAQHGFKGGNHRGYGLKVGTPDGRLSLMPMREKESDNLKRDEYRKCGFAGRILKLFPAIRLDCNL